MKHGIFILSFILFSSLAFGQVVRDLESVDILGERPITVRYVDRYVFDVFRDPYAKRMRMAEFMERVPGLASTPNGRIAYDGVLVAQILINGEPDEFINASTQFPMRLMRADIMHQIEIILPGSPQFNNDAPILNIITSRPLPNGIAVEVNAGANTVNAYGGNVNLVSKIRDAVVLRFGYSISYADSPRLDRHALRENLTENGETFSSLESSSKSWTDRRSHNIMFRGMAHIWNRPLMFGVSTAFSESNAHTDLQNTTFDSLGAEILSRTIRTVRSNQILPTLNADIDFAIRNTETRRTNISYRYNENRSESESLQASFYTHSPETPFRPNSENNQTQRTHHVFFNNEMRFGAEEESSLFRFMLNTSLNYINQNFDDLSKHYQARLPEEGVVFSRSAFGITQGFLYSGQNFSGQISVGLNYENLSGEFRGTENLLRYSQLSFLPQGSLTWRMSPNYRLLVNYVERTVRPAFRMLDPYVDETDPWNLSVGNPDLRPERLRRISVNLERAIRRQAPNSQILISPRFSYETIANAIERVTSVDDGVSLTTYRNHSRRSAYMLGLTYSMPLTSRILLNVSANYRILVFNSPEFGVDRNRVDMFDGAVRLSGRLWEGGNTELSYALNSHVSTSQATHASYSHSFSFSHTQVILRNRLFGTLSVSNPFESRQRVYSDFSGLNFRTESWREHIGRTVTFSLRWNFGRLRDRVPDANIIPDGTSRE